MCMYCKNFELEEKFLTLYDEPFGICKIYKKPVSMHAISIKCKYYRFRLKGDEYGR